MQSLIDSIQALLLILGQVSLDVASMLEGNLTALINSLIGWIYILAGMIYDVEALLEKGITLIIS